MKKIIKLISCLAVFGFGSCRAQSELNMKTWKIKEIKTNYISKGPKDVFELPDKNFKKSVIFQVFNDTLIIKNMGKGTFFCSDTLKFGRQFILNTRKQNDLSLIFPGDELNCLNENAITDSCYVSEKFMKILNINSNVLRGAMLTDVYGNLVNCKLFFVSQKDELILFSENNFLIFNRSLKN